MSIPVDFAKLAAAVTAYPVGYLLSSSDGGQVKAVTVEPTIDDGQLIITNPGGGSTRNIAVNPVVTVLFPPIERHGYTLLVDGTAVVTGTAVQVTPTGAVLHRPAAHSDGPAPPAGLASASTDHECGHDCAPVQ